MQRFLNGMDLLSSAFCMREMIDEDRLTKSPVKVSLLEEKIFNIFDGLQKNRDYVAMKSIGAFDVINRIDRRLDELNRLHETFKMAVLPDGGLKWKVLSGRTRIGKELTLLSPLCQEFFDRLAALCGSTRGQEGFRRAGQIAEEQHKRLCSEAFRKQFGRDIWVPGKDELPRYLEDDEWFKGLAEGLSKALLGLVASAYVLKEAFNDEFDLVFASAADKIEELVEAGIAVPNDFLSYRDQSLIDRQKRVFVTIALAASEAILRKYLAETRQFIGCANTIMEVRDGLEAMVKRIVMYHDFFELDMDFPHEELDAYIGYQSPLDRLEDEKAYLLRYINTKRTQLDAQKAYYLGKLWRMSPQSLERVKLNAALERENFRKDELGNKAKITDVVRLLKAHGREYRDALQKLETFDVDNDASIGRLPSDLDLRSDDEELVASLAAIKKCVQIRIEEFIGLATRLREEAARSRQLIEGGSFPEQARRKLTMAISELNDIRYKGESLLYTEQFFNTIEYYKNLSAAMKRLGEQCVQLIRSDLQARCRDFEDEDKKYVNYLGTVTRKFSIPSTYGDEGPVAIVTRYEEAQEFLFKEEERFITAYKEALLESTRGRIEKAHRTIVLEEMVKKLALIAYHVPGRPAMPQDELKTLDRLHQELFSQDLMADAQQYWIKVRELCEALSASIRVHLEVSMVTEEDRKASWEAVLEKLDSRFIALLATLETRLKQIDSNLAQVPEFNDIRLYSQPGPDLKSCAGNEKNLPGLRLQYLEGTYKAIHAARERTAKELRDLLKTAEALHLPAEYTARLRALAAANLDAAVVGFAELRVAAREWLKGTILNSIGGLDIPASGKWDLPGGATMASWLGRYDEFLDLFEEQSRAVMEEAADLRDRMTGSEEANIIRKKAIARCPMRELLKASDSPHMKEIAYLLFEADRDIETVRRGIELSLNKHDLQGVLDGCQTWRLLRKRLEEIAARRYPPGETTLLDALRDFEDRRIREYDLSKNKARFSDQALIEDIERAIIRYKLRDQKIAAKEFQKMVATLQKEGQVKWKDRSDEFLMTPGEYPEYRLTVVRSEEAAGSTRGTVQTGDRCVEFTYEPKKMLLVLKGK